MIGWVDADKSIGYVTRGGRSRGCVATVVR